MAAPGATEFELRRLRAELAAKDEALAMKDRQMDDLRDKTIDLLARHREETGELRSWMNATTAQLREVREKLIVETDEMGRLLARECIERNKIQRQLGGMLAQTELLRGVYLQASAAMPAIGLVPYDHRATFNTWHLADLVHFFRHLSAQLTRLRAAVGDELDKEGVCTALAVAARILSGLHHHDPSFQVDAIMDELAPTEHWRSLRVMAPHISAVVELEKERDFGSR